MERTVPFEGMNLGSSPSKGSKMSEYICICKHPINSGEEKEFEHYLTKYKGKELRDFMWKKPIGKLIRFMHYLVQIDEKIKRVKLATIY